MPGSSAIVVCATEFPRFKEAVSKVPIQDLFNIPESELKSQYRTFLERLEVMTANYDIKNLTQEDPKELIKMFFSTKSKLFLNIEHVMHAIAVCVVKHSCESVLESFVSRYEYHFDPRRNVDEQTSNEEFEIAVDSVVIEAMDSYWREKGSDQIRFF